VLEAIKHNGWCLILLLVVGEIGILTTATGNFNIITLEPQSCWRRSSRMVWRWRLLPVGG
jgi:hypothetical protein